MPKAENVVFYINGSRIDLEKPGDGSLLDFIRYELKLTGTKKACGQGHCGSCTVLLNGKPVKSCTVKLDSPLLQNAEITTIEGLGSGEGNLHPVQEAFVNAGALQCGYCTPGMVLTATALLNENTSPTRTEIREFIGSRNICRCTGYQKITDAVEDAARILRGEKSLLSVLPDDTSLRRKDAVQKVTGKVKYGDDIELEGMIYGKIKFSDIPSGILTGIDFSKAGKVKGFTGEITSEDIPGSGKIGMIERDQPALVGLNERIRTVSDPLAAVFCETREGAEEALKLIEAEYRKLPGVYSVSEALGEKAPLVHEDKKDNIFYSGSLYRGNPEKDMEASSIKVSGEFSTGRVAHGYMEVESGYALPDGAGGVEIYYPSQSVFDDRQQISEVLGLEREKVRVIQLPTGGAFGGKEDIILQHILALAALKFNRPVKISLTREESLKVVQKKHGIDFSAALGVGKDGKFRSLITDIRMDTGAYASLGFDIIENAMAFCGGPYYIPAVKINGLAVYTNNVMAGAMRGFGANQANFMIESLVDMAAEKLGMDPLEIRKINALKTGLPTVTDHILEPGIAGIAEALDKAETVWNKMELPPSDEKFSYGRGIACGVKNVGFGHGIPESAGAVAELDTEGNCLLTVSHHEYGQGAAAGEARIASEVLGIPVDRITVTSPDTGVTPFTLATTASRQTFLSGNATLGACRNLLSDIFSKASEKLKTQNPAALRLKGSFVEDSGSGEKLALSDLGAGFRAEFRAYPPETEGFPEGEASPEFGNPEFRSRRTHWGYAYGVQIAVVRVNSETGETSVKEIITVGDLGRVLNRRAVEAQQEGGVVMGVGYTLTEKYETSNGMPVSDSFAQLGLTRANQAPEITNLIVEVPHPWGPLGVKGLAEAPSLATAPAITNAIFEAAGTRIFKLPVERELLKKKQ